MNWRRRRWRRSKMLGLWRWLVGQWYSLLRLDGLVVQQYAMPMEATMQCWGSRGQSVVAGWDGMGWSSSMLSPWGPQCSAEVAEDSQWWLDGVFFKSNSMLCLWRLQCSVEVAEDSQWWLDGVCLVFFSFSNWSCYDATTFSDGSLKSKHTKWMGGTVVPPYMLCGASLMLLATEPPCIERPTCSFIGSIKKLIHVPLATSH